MAERQWTGSVAVLPVSLRDLAQDFMHKAHGHEDSPLSSYLIDHAYSLSEWGDAVEQLYARLDAKGSSSSVMTNAQGVALAARFTERTLGINLSRGSFGLPDDYIYAIARDKRAGVADFHFGIDPEGRVSS
jgi:hypothetical protein